jgi:archaellum biogenesis ATPase FlaH|tara:strand:+ start:188 stop:1630 length:1443 start_codon:yes stop_codon:yes gene_type:complete
MTRQNTDYGYDIQKVYLEMMMTDAESFVRCQAVFDPTSFDRRLQEQAKFLNDYVTDHNALPTFDMINASTNGDLKHPGDLAENHYDWLLQDFETFSKHKALEAAILKSADLLETGEYGACEDLVKKAVQIGLQKDLGTDYFADPRGRLEGIKDKNGQISTGWPALDKKLFGGFNRGELNIFAGGSGSGKSLFLANMGVNWALQGLNVVYLTFELSEALVSMRVDSMTTEIPSRDVFKNIDDVEMKVKMIGKKSGAFQVKYMPTGKNANDIRSYLKEYEIKTGKKVDVLLVDYLDLMHPIAAKISAENLFVKDKYVSEELRNLAMEIQTIFVTASQLNRSSVEEIEFDHSHISGGISKINTADNLIGIFTSRAMRERGRYQIQLMKTRSSSGVGQKIDLEFDVDSLRIRDLGEDEESDSYSSASASSGSILGNLKRGSGTTTPTEAINSDPNAGGNVGKIKGDADSTKLRSFLAGLGNDND